MLLLQVIITVFAQALQTKLKFQILEYLTKCHL